MSDTGLVVGIVVAAVILFVLKQAGIVVAMRVFGWKPRIFDEKQVTITVKSCTKQFFRECSNLSEEQVECMSDEQKRMMLEDIERYTRFVIERYVENYLLAK